MANDPEVSESSSTDVKHQKSISSIPNPSILPQPSTSMPSRPMSKNDPRLAALIKSSQLRAASPTTDKRKTFKKTQSQSHIQVHKTLQQPAHLYMQHETKKLKKSRSFDKNVQPSDSRHIIRPKQKLEKIEKIPS